MASYRARQYGVTPNADVTARVEATKAQERELGAAIVKRELNVRPSVDTGRGVPAIRALSVRVSERSWQNVSIRDGAGSYHKGKFYHGTPAELLRPMQPRALTPCISTMPDGTKRVIEPERATRSRKTIRAAEQDRRTYLIDMLKLAGNNSDVD